ncbi:hypothetical protein NDU88_007158 [Pleurodeles waltl]|uniref:Uncharacterized protein n=1 Tax=Pleurodeles waltl TaxID=8319 RepID=A0AAV7NSB5_PLEWA|nr:hypothetical protein NDU88_007158 [Pleurodeles waltl]
MADVRFQNALALLEHARRMDMVRPEALGLLHPAHRASAGVAAAVMACSPPRAVRMMAQVRRGRRRKGGPGKKGAARGGRRCGKGGVGVGRPKRKSSDAGAPAQRSNVKGGAQGHEPAMRF